MTSDKVVQVLGKIDFDKVTYNTDEVRLEFAVYDAETADEASAERMKVAYYGVVPGNFDQATSVVLKGKFDGDMFVADQMLVKCPSYQGEEGDAYQNVEEHNQAVAADGV